MSSSNSEKPPALDQDGKMINPHNPEFITKVPWYLGNTGPTLKHHSVQSKSRELTIAETDELIAKKLAAQSEVVTASKRTTYRKGACKNCGAVTHQEKDCLERPRSSKKMAWKSGLDIAADEVVLNLEQHGKLSYAAKRDQWKGFDPTEYQEIVERHNRLEDDRRKEQEAEREAKAAAEKEAKHAAKLARKVAKAARKNGKSQEKQEGGSDKAGTSSPATSDFSDASDSDVDNSDVDDDYEDFDDGVKASDANTRDFQGTLIPQGGVGGNGMRITSRNLRIREDTPKYLRNLSLDSAFYDPKSRSMRSNPYGNAANPEDLPFAGDNFVRYSGDAVELAKNQVLCWEMTEKGAMPDSLAELGGAGMIDVIANPSQAEFLKKQFEKKKQAVELEKKKELYAKYLGEEYVKELELKQQQQEGGSTTSSSSSSIGLQPKGLDIRLRLGQTEAYMEYDREGRVIKGPDTTVNSQGIPLASSVTKYEEDYFPLNHTSVWGSYYSRARACWGYACCHSTMKNAYCTGSVGKSANDAAMMQEGHHLAKKQAKEDDKAQARPPVPLFGGEGAGKGTSGRDLEELSDKERAKLAALKDRFDSSAGKKVSGKRGIYDLEEEAKEKKSQEKPKQSFSSGAAVDMSEEDMEEYRRKRVKHEDPMAAYLSNPDILLDR